MHPNKINGHLQDEVLAMDQIRDEMKDPFTSNIPDALLEPPSQV
jgi:hypothetical protein